jgi:flavin reductase (DIM6/NTAB) family NADH-FMN oxidoreductase RutF
MDQRSFRDLLGRFPTGVVLVTAEAAHGPVGMAVNSFVSVSLEPALIALCVGRSSTTWPSLRATGGFAVSILGDGHAELCRLFATQGADRFSGRTWVRTPAGRPTLPDALGWLDCDISAIHPAGDHDLVVASVDRGAVTESSRPLVFHAGRFRGLAG